MTFLPSMTSSSSSPLLQIFSQGKVRKKKVMLSDMAESTQYCRLATLTYSGSVESSKNRAKGIVKLFTHQPNFSAQLAFARCVCLFLQACHMLPTVKVRE